MTDLDFTAWDLRTEEDRRAFPGGLEGPAPAWDVDTTLVDMVLEQARRTPEAEAVRIGEQALTYRELVDGAARVARWAAALRRGPEDRRELRVGVIAHRRLPVYPALLGVLAAGGAYVPLDPAAPTRRLREVADRAQLSAVVADAEGWAGLGLSGTPALLIDRALPFQRGRLGGGSLGELDALPEVAGALSGAGLPPGPGPDDVAYAIFTSGSTGTPKGVLVEHRSAVNLARWAAHTTGLTRDSRVTQNASLHFDASVQQIFSAWSAGATVLPVPEAVRGDGALLYGWLAAQAITHWDSVPSLWAPVVEHCARRIAAGEAVLPALRAVLLAGEVLPAARVNQWRPWQQGHRLFNVYGPTEVTVDATSYEVTGPVTGSAPPIGSLLPGLRALVLDTHGHPCPPEADGELLLGGIGLARGYLGDRELTRERFITRDGERWYRTGDIVRYTAQAELVFGGRRDEQVKLNGVRLELPEVERALGVDPRVADAIAVVLDDGRGRRELAAAVVPRTPVTGAALRAALAEELPAAMVPGRILVVDVLPRTANGKVDRGAVTHLLRDAAETGDHGTEVQALTDTGRRLLGLWRHVLRRPELGPDDDFFRSGGDSIATIRLRRHCADAGLRLQAMDVFTYPTVRRLAGHLDRTGFLRPTARTASGDPSLLLPAQRRLAVATLLTDRVPQLGLVQESHEYEEEFDATAMRTALDLLSERHEVLRTGVGSGADGLRARIVERVTIPLTVHRAQGTGLAERRAEGRAFGDAALREGFDLSEPPLLKVTAVELEPGRFSLIWTLHHVISDGWSWELVQDEFERLYASVRAGRFQPLPAPPLPLRELTRRLAELPPAAPSEEWLAGLEAVEPLALPRDRQGRDADRAHLEWTVPPETDAAVRAVAAAAGCAPSAGYLLAYAEALGAVCRQSAFALGVVSSGRNVDIPHIERAVACLARSLPVPVDPSGTSHERLRRLHRHLAAVLALDSADPDEILAGRPPGVRDPAAVFVFQNYPDVRADAAPLRRAAGADQWRETGSEPLALVCHENDGRFYCRLEHEPAAVPAPTAALLAREIRRALERLAAEA
ncbi:amino acid adenylation domain-containing protein [Streptomyces bacillaris]|uniref:amino acid adenylation domain-containing protein n=1 Tax=Streptomyces bacillaris TaxID=68179 RepID=UPI0035D91E62